MIAVAMARGSTLLSQFPPISSSRNLIFQAEPLTCSLARSREARQGKPSHKLLVPCVTGQAALGRPARRIKAAMIVAGMKAAGSSIAFTISAKTPKRIAMATISESAFAVPFAAAILIEVEARYREIIQQQGQDAAITLIEVGPRATQDPPQLPASAT